jgi:hypothetical protein
MLSQFSAAEIDINIHVKAKINVTPFVARQKVNVLLLDKVGTGLLAGKPKLMVNDGRLFWQVPVAVSVAGLGRLGQVGTVAVDVQTAELVIDERSLREMADHADRLAEGPAP